MELSFYINWTILFQFVSYSFAESSSSYTRELNFEVFENVPSGTLIGIITGPTPPYLTVGLDSNDLSIDESNGEIRTRVEILDREIRETYSFIVIPIVGGGAGDNLRVSVHVKDTNDNAPTFPVSHISVDFPENTPRDVKRTLLPARDADLGIFNTQRYVISEGNINNAFRLSSHRERDGVLYLDLQVNGFLDRETTPTYTLVIDAYDGGLPPLKGSLTVHVSLEDVNDNSPIFNQSRYFATISENATFGTPVLQVFATDTDSGPNGQITYSINRRQTDKDSTFQIDSETGLISVVRPLDFESKESHELVVVAKDNGLQPLETTVFVSIRVIDVNDHEPIISLNYLTSDGLPQIYENSGAGEFIARISVIDPRDSSTEYSEAKVSVNGGYGDFGITVRNGVNYLMVTSNKLDRERKADYLLNLIATNSEFNISTVIKLKVLDLNDNPPAFTQSEYWTSVLEVAEPGTGILQLSAMDPDLGNSSKITYSISSGSKWFGIHPNTGLISTLEKLDCEFEPIPKLIILAQDGGNPSLSSSTVVHVQIQDVNDNEPVFDHSFYNVSIKEDSQIGMPILKVSASDPDCGINSIVKYGFHGISGTLDLPFSINETTGEILVLKQLDYETKSTYTLSVEASDSGGLSSIAIVKIALLDVNDNEPIFHPTTYESTIASSTSPGTLILIVKATDLDSNSNLKYSIVDGNTPNSAFSISTVGGEGRITIEKSLSQSTNVKYTLKLRATDAGGRIGTSTAIINVVETNTNSLLFSKSRYNFIIDEDVPIGSIVGNVGVTTVAKGSKNTIKYSISSGDPNSYFRIDELTGQITTRAPLDHEKHSKILLTIQSTDTKANTNAAFAQVEIQITDINDHDPEFEINQITIWIPESTAVGSVLYVVHAQDRDRDSGKIQYTLSYAQEAMGLFSLDPNNNGHLVLKEPLDYESVKKYRLIVGAKDSGIPPRYSRNNLTINIEVQDVNDNAPVFDQEQYIIKVSEGTAVGANLTTVHAIDEDTGNNAKITYTLTPKVSNPTFDIESNSGILTLKSNLDRELQDSYTLTVVGTDHGVPAQLSSSTTIRIEILDENDHEPEFNEPFYKFSIQENNEPGGRIGEIRAIDKDAGKNGQVQYLIQPSHSSFHIGPNTGILTATVPLDREKQSYYELQVVAYDSGSPIPRQAEVLVYVSVADANDWAPRIIEPEVDRLVIHEGAREGTELTQIVASDEDDGFNSTVEFSFVDGNGDFSIDPKTGIIRTTTSKLSTSSKPFYNLVIRARDKGIPSLETIREYRVEVVDSDELLPSTYMHRMRSKFQFKVSESARIGQVLGTVPIVSQMQDGGVQFYKILNANVIATDNNVFEIDSSTGKILVAQPLDYEKMSHYTLEIGPIDNSITSSSDYKIQVSIEILDENDESPKFTQDPVLFSIPESTPVGSSLWNLTAVDLDDGLNGLVHYNIQEQSPKGNNGKFRINPLSGTLYLTEALDFERQSSYLLIVGATDQAIDPAKRRSTNLTVQITIEDENDNAPIFVSSSKLILYRNEPTNRPIHTIVAMDRDSNSKIVYTINSGNEDQTFNLNSLTGELSLQNSLSNGRSNYNLNVTAKDAHHSTSQILQIVIQQWNSGAIGTRVGSGNAGNHSPPKFIEPIYEGRILENSPIGTEVVKVTAIMSSGEISNMKYLIPQSMSNGIFSIDSTTGLITVAGLIDREIVDRFNLTVYAYNSNYDFVYDTTSVVIRVLDVNDNAPVLRCLDLVIPENQETSLIHHFHGTDPDAGKNGEITYSIVSGNSDNLFSLDLHNGKLKSRPLDRERRAVYNLLVLAQDQGLPVQKTTCNFTLRVQDSNDNSPVFLESEYSVSISENTGVGSTVLVVEATDSDEGINAELRYALYNETETAFGIDSKTGAIFTRGPLDREIIPEYIFEVIAMDGGLSDSRSSKTIVRISLNDINDNPPRFVPSENPTIVKLETITSRPGTVVAQMSATDPDEGLNSEILYELQDNHHGTFRINSQAGSISTTNVQLEPKIYYLTVVAKDQGLPHLKSAKLVIIQPANLVSALKFTESSYESEISENSAVGTQVVQVNAVKTDGRRQKINYSILDGNQHNAFSIGLNNGQIVVANSTNLNREKTTEFVLLISAQLESGSATAITHTSVRISLLDENDSAPTFTQDHYFATVSEGGPKGSFVIQVKALDQDQSPGPNTNLIYYIVDGNMDNSFTIDPPNSGIIKTNLVLDREIQDSYTLSVLCTDEGYPNTNSATTLVTVRVVDSNDNFPILPPVSTISVGESLRVGSIVTTIVGNDVDSSPSLSYSFTRNGNPGQMFSIGKYNGEITLGKVFNYMHQTKHELEVQVSDSVHSARAIVTVNVVQDANKTESTIFEKRIYHIGVSDDTKPGTKIFQIPNANKNNIKYSILRSIKSSISSKIYIDENSGGIFTNGSIQSYNGLFNNELTLIARDSTNNFHILQKATLLIEVKSSEEDKTLEFSQENYSVLLKTTDTANTLVLRPTVDYENKFNHLHLHYEIVAGNQERYFTINSHSGDIRTTKPPLPGSFNLNISASCLNSMECFTYAQVHINVTGESFNNVHDASVSNFNVSLSESASIGSIVFKFNNTSPYIITSGNIDSIFGITNSQELILRNPLDYEKITEYNLVIQQRNTGKLFTIHIQVQDSNDHIPTFPLSSYHEFLRENQPIGTPVFRISAVDLDTGNLTYSILENNMRDKFRIHSNSGLITSLMSFDYESTNRYYLTVRASDESGQFSSVRVQIDIVSVDEYEPKFASPSYRFVVPSNARTSYIIGRVHAKDEDSGVDGYVRYSIIGKSNQFKVNRTTGILILKTTDPAQILYNETVSISASSGKQGSRSTVVPVEIRIGEPSAEIELANLAAGSGNSVIPLLIGIILGSVAIIFIIFTIIIVLRLKRSKKNNNSPKSDPNSLQKHNGVLTSEYNNSSTLEYPSANNHYISPEYSVDCHLSHKSHSGSSSGRGSAGDEDPMEMEDEEIRMIHENSVIGGPDAASSYIQQTLWDSVVNDGDECLDSSSPSIHQAPAKNTQEYLARLGIKACSTIVGEDGDGDQCGVYDVYAQIPDDVDESMIGPARRTGPGSMINHSGAVAEDSHDLRGSYNWDYLQDWGGPQYQSLVNVLAAVPPRSEHGDTNDSESGTGTYSGVYNPKRAASTAAKSRQSVVQNHLAQRAQGPLPPLPRSHPSSIISHHDSFTSPMSPNFTPELSFCPPPTTGIVDRADLIINGNHINPQSKILRHHHNGGGTNSSCYNSSSESAVSDIKI